MAGEVASAYVALLPSFKGGAAAISRELDGPAEAAGRSAGEKAGRSMSASIGSALKTGLVVGGGLLASLGAAGLKAGIQTASGMEQARIGFSTMLGSGQKADSFLRDLSAFAAKTPFEFPELQTAASSLISAGVNANKVIPIMTSLGNATSGMGTGAEGVKRATVALQQMNAAGKITGEDLNQLRDAGIPVYDLLAAATGKSKEQVADLAAKGKLGRKELEQLMAALESGKGLERFSGLMDKQSASLAGLWSTFKDTINLGLATAVQPLIPVLKDGLGQATAFVAAQMPRLAEGLATVIAGAPGFIARISHAKDIVQGFFDLIVRGDFTGSLGRAMNWDEDEALVGKILRVRDVIVGVFEAFGDQDGAADRLSLALGVDDDQIYRIVDGLRSVRDSIGDFFSTLASGDFTPLTETFAKLGPLASDASASLPALNAAIDTTSTVFGFVADHMDLVVQAMPFLLAAFAAYKTLQIANNALGKDSLIGFALHTAAIFAQVGANLALASSNRALAASSVEAAGAESVGLLTRIRTTAATVASTVASVAARVATVAWTAIQWLLNAALTANPIGIVVVAIGLLVGALVWAWNNSETFREVVLKVWAEVKARVLGVIDWLRSAVPAAFQWVLNAFLTYTPLGVIISHWSQIRDFVGGAVDTVKRWVSEGWASLLSTTTTTFVSIVTSVRERLAGLLDAVTGPIRTVLRWIGDHFVNPLNDMLGKVGVDFRIPWPSFADGGPVSASVASGARHAGGGTIQGFSPNPRADNIPIWATANEFMIRQRSSLRLRRRFPGLLEYMNEHGSLPGFANGGLVGGGYADGGIIGTVTGFLSNVGRFFTDPLGAIGDYVKGLLGGIGDNFWAKAAGGALTHVVGGLVKKVQDFMASMGGVGQAEYLGAGRVSIGGRLLDATTAGIFQKASAILGGLQLIQGSWSSSVGASKGTHSGAGAMDVWPSNGNWRRAVDVLRSLGDIAWHRTVAQGFSGDHIHGITPNVPGLSPEAAAQVAAYHAGRNGLASGGPDNHGYWRGGRIRALLADNGTVLRPGLNFVQNNTGAPEPLARVDQMQRAGLVVEFNGPVGWDPDEVARRMDARLRDSLAVENLQLLAVG